MKQTTVFIRSLKAALPFFGDRSGRALDCVRVTEAGATIAANGHALIRIQPKDVEPADEAVSLPWAKVAELVRTATLPVLDLRTEEDGKYVARLATKLSDETTAPGDLVEGSFPKFGPLFDRERTGGEITFAIGVLESLLKAAKVYGSDTMITLETGAHDEATRFVLRNAYNDESEIDGLIMPISK